MDAAAQTDVATDLPQGADPGTTTTTDPGAPTSDPGAPTPDLGSDSGEPPADTAAPPEPKPQLGCGSGNRTLPEGLTALAWDDGAGEADLLQNLDAAFTVGETTTRLSEQPVHEAVRFELEHPARVHGFSVQWTAIPEGAAAELELPSAIYLDFGYNGRDFWHEEPLWQGTRCAGDVSAGTWLTYVPELPVDMPPGLVHVAHRREGPQEPGFLVDTTGSAPQWWAVEQPWDAHSAVNLPEAGSYSHEVTLQAQWHFMVRLHVEYVNTVPAEQRLFRSHEGPAANRASLADVDGDGLDDLLSRGKLHKNLGGLRFEDVTEAAGLEGESIGGGVFGDFDNDGCLDLFAFSDSTGARDSLWRSDCEGRFTNVTDASGINDEQSSNLCEAKPEQNHIPSPAAAWWDLDSDGLLDLYVVGFVCWPDESYYPDQVFLNQGDGTFTDISLERGFLGLPFAGRGANPIDHDRDGDVDLLVNNYRLQKNLFFENQGDGTVKEVAEALRLSGVPTDVGYRQIYFGHTIGTAWGDLNSDGYFDVVQANLAHPRFFEFSDKTQVLLQTDIGPYIDAAVEWDHPMGQHGIPYSETHSVPALADFDHDGDLDLVISAIYEGRPTDFLWGDGDGTFTWDSYRAGIGVTNGWGLAAGDLDNDGDPDLAYSGIWENHGAARGSWLQVRVVGDEGSNHAAIGATVELHAAGRTWLRYVPGGTGQGNQDSMYLHFGLGPAATVDSISVTFPGGKRVDYEGPWDAGRRLWVYESGKTREGWGAETP